MASYSSPVHQVAGKFIEAGYRIAGRSGVEQKQLDPNMITILKSRKPVQRSFLGLKIPFLYREPRALNVGKVYFNDADKNATEDKNWVFEAHGIKEKSKLTAILEEAKPSHVKIQSTLGHPVPKREIYLHELCNFSRDSLL
jgi:hypothetical protein